MKLLVNKKSLEEIFIGMEKGDYYIIATNGNNGLFVVKNRYTGNMEVEVCYNDGWNADNGMLVNNIWRFDHPQLINKGLKSIIYRKWFLNLAKKYN